MERFSRRISYSDRNNPGGDTSSRLDTSRNDHILALIHAIRCAQSAALKVSSNIFPGEQKFALCSVCRLPDEVRQPEQVEFPSEKFFSAHFDRSLTALGSCTGIVALYWWSNRLHNLLLHRSASRCSVRLWLARIMYQFSLSLRLSFSHSLSLCLSLSPSKTQSSAVAVRHRCVGLSKASGAATGLETLHRSIQFAWRPKRWPRWHWRPSFKRPNLIQTSGPFRTKKAPVIGLSALHENSPVSSRSTFTVESQCAGDRGVQKAGEQGEL